MTEETSSAPAGDQAPADSASSPDTNAVDGGQLGGRATIPNNETVYVGPPKKRRGFHPGLVLATILVVLGIIYAFPTLLMWVCDIPRDGSSGMQHNKQVLQQMRTLPVSADRLRATSLDETGTPIPTMPQNLIADYTVTSYELVMPDGLSRLCIFAVPKQVGWAYLYCPNQNGGTFYMQKDDKKGLILSVNQKLVMDGWLPLDKDLQ